MAGDNTANAKMKPSETVCLAVKIRAGAPLPQAIQALLGIARRCDCLVTATWQDQEVVVSPRDTFQGVQRRVLKATADADAKHKTKK